MGWRREEGGRRGVANDGGKGEGLETGGERYEESFGNLQEQEDDRIVGMESKGKRLRRST